MSKQIKNIGRLIALLFLIQILSISMVFAQSSGVTETKLDNGLTVLMKEVHSAPVFTAQVWFKVGSKNEHTGITGISHLLEHMLFNSSKNYKKGAISAMIRERGGIENAATWTDFTYYWQLLSKDNLEFSLKSLSERVGNALLLEPEFQNERTVVYSEMQGKENDPDTLLYQAVVATAFKVHPYRWPTIGWESDLKNWNRSQLVNYYHTYYFPNNATLVLVGDFDSAKAMKLIKKYFGTKPAGKLPRPPYTTEPVQDGQRIVYVKKEGTSQRVLIAFHTPAINNSDNYALMVLDQIMSGGRSSRLYQALVEKQLATEAYSNADIRKDPGLFMVGATARNGVTADELQKALLEQVEKAKATLPTEQEIKAAKNQLEANLVFQNDSVSDQGEQLGYYNTVASWRYLETLILKIKEVTPEDVQRVAKKYLYDDNMTVGKFIPTGAPAGGSEVGGSFGPMHLTKVPDASSGVCYYHLPNKNTSSSVCASVGSGPAKEKQASKPKRFVLDNGMVLIVQENHSNPTLAISGNLKAGSCFDPSGKNGVAAMTADMLERGTKTRSALDLAKASESVGASIGISAGLESANFGGKSLSKDFPIMLDLLSDELRNANFPQEQFEKAKGESLSGLEQSKESTDAQVTRAFYNSIYPSGHPYHKLKIDLAEKSLNSITRDDLVSFYEKYYRPDTATIVVVGDVDANKAFELVKKYFGDWKADGPAPKVDIPTIYPQQSPVKIVVPMMDKSQVDILFGYALGMKRNDPDFYAARLMNQILGGGGAMGSILGNQIREKNGLAYDVYSTFDASLGGGPWYAALGTNPKNADKAISMLKSETAKFKKNGATQMQFKQARDFIIGVFPIALETNEGVARMLLNSEFYGLGMDYIQNYTNIYKSITLGQVNSAAKKYLHPENAALVIAGPYKEK